MKFYAGIGSRETPPQICQLMTSLAVLLSDDYILRSGGAKGADLAFEKGAKFKEIFYAKDATEESIKLASTLHPAWHKCNNYTRKLHGRNMMIILGSKLSHSVDFIVCWTPNGELKGGTAMALRLALSRQIQVYNLAIDKDKEEIIKRSESI